MANSFLKPELINRTGIQLLRRELVLHRLVWNYSESGVDRSSGDTVNYRVPAVLDAREYAWRNDRTNPIVLDEITESTIPVSLDKHPYSAVAITDEELRLDIVDFSDQVLAPQARAVAEKLESYVGAEIAAATYATSVPFAEATDEPYAIAVQARAALNKANVPMEGRVLLLGADVEAAFLMSDHINKVDQSGSDSALRDATIGRVAGFQIVTTNSIPATSAYAFHRSAFGIATVAPMVPDGAAYGSSQSVDGLGMRWIRDYDAMYMRDRSVVSAFAGTATVTDGGSLVRAVEIAFTPAA